MNASLAALLFWISVAVCALAELAIVIATARASRRPGTAGAVAADLPQVDGARALPLPRRWLEVLYAAAPALVLAILFAFTWRAMHPPLPGTPSSADTPRAPIGAPMTNR
jgi:heme/copper-type cytochrome/quinol oxidase subunit 2